MYKKKHSCTANHDMHVHTKCLLFTAYRLTGRLTDRLVGMHYTHVHLTTTCIYKLNIYCLRQKDWLTHRLMQLHHSHIIIRLTTKMYVQAKVLLFMAERQADAHTGTTASLTHIRLTTTCMYTQKYLLLTAEKTGWRTYWCNCIIHTYI